jgi:peptidyl-prolyl cis-trans isomerase SurA
LALGLFLAGSAAGQYLEKIVAVVEDQEILLSEVTENYQLLASQGVVDASDTAAVRTIQRQILDKLIDDKLLILEAESQEIQVTGEEVEQAVEQTINGFIDQIGGRDAFLRQLEQEGLTEEELRTRYREDARSQILASRLIGREIRSKIEVTDEDVREFYEENRDELPKKVRMMRISDIYISVRADSLIVGRRFEEASLIRDQILGGEVSFEEAAQSYSDDPSGAQGGNLGRFGRGDFDPAFEEAAFALAPGEISEPVRTRFGLHLIRLDQIDPEGQWANVHHILFGIAPSRVDEAMAKKRAEGIRDRIVGGESFESVAREVSEDPQAASRGGDLGWLPMQAFQGAVKETVDSLGVGEVSDVVPGDGGFHILKITGVQEPGEYTFEEIQEDLAEMAFQSRMEEAYAKWMEDLREKYYVEVHPLDF